MSKSASSPFTRSSTEVRSSSRRTSCGLPVEHLGQQVLRHRPFTAGKLGREPVRVRVPGQRERRQPQPRRPALGALIQQLEGWAGQLYPGRFEQRPRLLAGKAQVGRADLGELPRQPQPVQTQPQIVAGGEHEPQPGGSAHHQQLQLAQRLLRAQLVQVIDHQPDPVLQRGQIGQQSFDDHPAVQIRCRHQGPHQLRPGGRFPQRAEYGKPEPLRVTFLALHWYPRGESGQVRLGDPGSQQERLPASGGRRHLSHASRPVEQREKPRAGNEPVPDGGSGCSAGAPGPVGRPHDALLDTPATNTTPSAATIADLAARRVMRANHLAV